MTIIEYNINLDSCKINNPTGYCYMDYFKSYFDVTPNNNRNCGGKY